MPPTATPVGAAGSTHSALDEAYAAERTAMAKRHQDELANPKAAETVVAQSQRQAAERQELEARYAKAKSVGAKTLPPPADADKRNK